MRHLVVIVSSYGRHGHHFPIIAKQGANRIFMFVDHCTPPARRQSVLAEHVAITDIASVEVHYTAPCPTCDQGAHPWDPINDARGVTVGVNCPRCGRTEPLPEPFPGESRTIDRGHFAVTG